MKLVKSVLRDIGSIILAFLIIGIFIAPIIEKIAPPPPSSQESVDRFFCAMGLSPRDTICVQDLYADLVIRFESLTAEHERLLQQTPNLSPELGP